MDSSLSLYLDKVDRYLKPMPASERADIINEIKSEMMELETKGKLSPEQIIERLGTPKELAGAYLGEVISKSSRFSLKKLCAVVAFYSFAGVGSLFVLPITNVFSFRCFRDFVVCGRMGAMDVDNQIRPHDKQKKKKKRSNKMKLSFGEAKLTEETRLIDKGNAGNDDPFWHSAPSGNLYLYGSGLAGRKCVIPRGAARRIKDRMPWQKD